MNVICMQAHFSWLLQVHYLPGDGGATFNPEFQGALNDVAASPNDPLFILHHMMMDCILVEWLKRHPSTKYPVHPDIRDGHRKDDYIRSYFPLITNGEAFPDTQDFGYYCKLPNIGSIEPIGILHVYQVLSKYPLGIICMYFVYTFILSHRTFWTGANLLFHCLW